MKKILPLSERSESKVYTKSRSGFTLVELLVVVSIIAILSVIGLVIFTGAQKGARDAKRRGDVDAISKVLETHYNTTLNQYCTGNVGTYCAPQATWFAGGVVPTDPKTNDSYTVLPADGSATYQLKALLETGGGNCQTTAPNDSYCVRQQQ